MLCQYRGYVGIHSSGFRDFLLKPELLRAIVDSGFEHPSEGKSSLISAFDSAICCFMGCFIFFFWDILVTNKKYKICCSIGCHACHHLVQWVMFKHLIKIFELSEGNLHFIMLFYGCQMEVLNFICCVSVRIDKIFHDPTYKLRRSWWVSQFGLNNQL